MVQVKRENRMVQIERRELDGLDLKEKIGWSRLRSEIGWSRQRRESDSTNSRALAQLQ
jgi:hypothetical protein